MARNRPIYLACLGRDSCGRSSSSTRVTLASQSDMVSVLGVSGVVGCLQPTWTVEVRKARGVEAAQGGTGVADLCTQNDSLQGGGIGSPGSII